MASYSPEQIFALAQHNYAECEEIINTVTTALNNNSDQPLDPKVPMICFDLILQSCFLNAAVNDGELEHNEIVFITNVTKYADLLDFVNQDMKAQNAEWPTITWDVIPQLESEVQQNLALAATAIVDKYAEAFVKLFATVDKILTDVDLLAMLKEKVGIMLIGITGIDGDDIESDVATNEGGIAFAAFEVLVTQKWKEITGE